MLASAAPPTLWSDTTASVATKVEGRRLDEWVDLLHTKNCHSRGWDLTTLHPGSFGFEILAVSVLGLSRAPRDSTDEQLAAIVHSAWSAAYVYWRENPPSRPYRLPYKALGDAERNSWASKSFAELPVEEQAKDLVVVRGFLANRRAAH